MFEILNDRIKTPNGGLIIFQGMQDHTADSIKSLEGFDGAWVEEAQSLSERSLTLLRPTIRKPGSELWFSWNPRRKSDPVDKLLRGDDLPTDAIVVRANWSDNPWFPDVLEQERQDCKRTQPEQYGHIWEGDYAGVYTGAYYARHLLEAKAQGRIGRVSADPLMALRVYCDLGGAGAKADAFTMWVVQFVGREVRALNYYEAVGQPAAEHFAWLRDNGYQKAEIYLPHDGLSESGPNPGSWEASFRAAGYKVRTLRGEGSGNTGARSARIEATRKLFPSIWFNEATTEAGRAALGWYHEKKDEDRDVGLGPEHDWSSHGADSFGLMCVDYEPPRSNLRPQQIPNYGAV
jgi:phage terminase large subunit